MQPSDAARLAHQRGVAALADGDPRRARAWFERALAADPGLGEAHYHAALALRQLGDLRGAIALARRAVALLRGRPEPQAQLGALLLLEREPLAATACLRAALALDPGHAAARYLLAMALASQGEREGAEVELRAALERGLGALTLRAEAQLADLRSPGPLRAFSLCSAPMATELLPGALASPREGEGEGEGERAPRGAGPPRGDGPPRVVALTGAGLSAASGLRTRKELWQSFDRDDAVSVWKFHENPAALWRVVIDFLGEGGHEPNEGHRALAALPGLVGVVTQNVDGLHQRAHRELRGGEAPYPVVELHGTLERTLCHRCGRGGEGSSAALVAGRASWRGEAPRCGCGGALRPDVVLFGEPVAAGAARQARALVEGCEVLLVVGCAMDVSPASELPAAARRAGARVIEVKRRASRLGRAVEVEHAAGEASRVLPALLAALASSRGSGSGMLGPA